MSYSVCNVILYICIMSRLHSSTEGRTVNWCYCWNSRWLLIHNPVDGDRLCGH